MRYVLAHPESVASLVLMDTSAEPSGMPTEIIDQLAEVGRADGMGAVFDAINEFTGSPPNADARGRFARMDVEAFAALGRELGDYPSMLDDLADDAVSDDRHRRRRRPRPARRRRRDARGDRRLDARRHRGRRAQPAGRPTRRLDRDVGRDAHLAVGGPVSDFLSQTIVSARSEDVAGVAERVEQLVGGRQLGDEDVDRARVGMHRAVPS